MINIPLTLKLSPLWVMGPVLMDGANQALCAE